MTSQRLLFDYIKLSNLRYILFVLLLIFIDFILKLFYFCFMCSLILPFVAIVVVLKHFIYELVVFWGSSQNEMLQFLCRIIRKVNTNFCRLHGQRNTKTSCLFWAFSGLICMVELLLQVTLCSGLLCVFGLVSAHGGASCGEMKNLCLEVVHVSECLVWNVEFKHVWPTETWSRVIVSPLSPSFTTSAWAALDPVYYTLITHRTRLFSLLVKQRVHQVKRQKRMRPLTGD